MQKLLAGNFFMSCCQEKRKHYYENVIDYNEKDGCMYILPECIVGIKHIYAARKDNEKQS